MRDWVFSFVCLKALFAQKTNHAARCCWIWNTVSAELFFSLRDCGLFGKRMLNRVKNMFMTKFSTTCGTTSIKFWEVCHCVDVLCWVWFILVVRVCLLNCFFVSGLFWCDWQLGRVRGRGVNHYSYFGLPNWSRLWGQEFKNIFICNNFEAIAFVQLEDSVCFSICRQSLGFVFLYLQLGEFFPNDFDFECHFPFVFKQQALKSPNQCLNTKTSINISKISNGKTFVIWVPKPAFMPVHLPTCLFSWLFVCLFVCYIAHCFSVWDNALQTWYLQVNRKQNEMYKTTERHGERMPKFSEHMPPLKETTKNDAINHCHRCCCCLVMQTFCWGGCLDGCFVEVVWGSLLKVMFICHFCCGLAGVEDPKKLRFDFQTFGGIFLILRYTQNRGFWTRWFETPNFAVLARGKSY